VNARRAFDSSVAHPDDALLDAQYSRARSHRRPVYDKASTYAAGPGKDVKAWIKAAYQQAG
jgi:hypothetical protein